MTKCPSETTVAGFINGTLRREALEDFYQHLSQCQSCAELVLGLKASSTTPSGTSSTVDVSKQADADAPCAFLGDEAEPDGKWAGRYRVERLLGIGGMGMVYTAHDTQLNRRVALKVMRPGSVQQSMTRLLREAQAMAQLSHPNVVAVYDVGTWKNRAFVAMELIEGETLSSWILAQPRPWREILDKFVIAGGGLEAAHRAGLVHRDFKPENVLVGKQGEIRVTDFGLARSVSESESSTGGESSAIAGDGSLPDALRLKLTKVGTVLGTPAYMAPEQIAGQLADHRADVFSFCAALYEGLYRELPFPGRTVQELFEAIQLGQVRRPPAKCRIPASIRRVLLRGLAKSPDDRYQTMRALLGDLALDRHTHPRSRQIAIMTVMGLTIMTAALAAAKHWLAEGDSQRARPTDTQGFPGTTQAASSVRAANSVESILQGTSLASGFASPPQASVPAVASSAKRVRVTGPRGAGLPVRSTTPITSQVPRGPGVVPLIVD